MRAIFLYGGERMNDNLTQMNYPKFPGKYVISELSKIYTFNDQRTGLILRKIEEYLPDYRHVRALCFCVDVEHAKNMQAKFQLAGLNSGYLVSDNGAERVLWSR